MKKVIGVLIACTIVFASCNKKTSHHVALKNESDSLSYYIGLSVGGSLKQSEVEKINTDAFAMGLEKVYAGDSINQMEVNTKIRAYFTKKQMEIAGKNLKEGEDFLAKNKTKPGIVELPSGLQYEVEKEGTGPIPDSSDVVSFNYVGSTIDGKEFESSYKMGQPATAPVTRLIPGWTEALLRMKVGSKWKLYIPSKLGYGMQGTPNGAIKPNSALIFEVELLGIEPKNDTTNEAAPMPSMKPRRK